MPRHSGSVSGASLFSHRRPRNGAGPVVVPVTLPRVIEFRHAASRGRCAETITPRIVIANSALALRREGADALTPRVIDAGLLFARRLSGQQQRGEEEGGGKRRLRVLMFPNFWTAILAFSPRRFSYYFADRGRGQAGGFLQIDGISH